MVLLTGSLDEDRKRANRGLINRGEAQLVIGTHALIEEKVEFDRLGPGGRRRAAPVWGDAAVPADEKAPRMARPEPDVLVMTATPIPRTLALSLYGDLDVSVLDELPPGPNAHCDAARAARSAATRCGILCASRWGWGGRRTLSIP